MKLQKNKDVINNSRLMETCVQGIIKDVISLFETPMNNSGLDSENIGVTRFFDLTLTNLIVNITNVGNGIRAMLVLKQRTDAVEMTEDQIHDLYTLSCKGAAENTFLILDAFVLRDFYLEINDTIKREYVLNAYDERHIKFHEIIGNTINDIEKFGIKI